MESDRVLGGLVWFGWGSGIPLNAFPFLHIRPFFQRCKICMIVRLLYSLLLF